MICLTHYMSGGTVKNWFLPLETIKTKDEASMKTGRFYSTPSDEQFALLFFTPNLDIEKI
ncbi:hypothetical protein NPIL_658821, partial [Nephila pilipes]